MLYEKIISLIRLIRCSYKYMSMRKIISLIIHLVHQHVA